MKYIIKLIVMAFLLSKLLGCSKAKNESKSTAAIYPEESFSIIESSLQDGKPVVGSFNFGYKNYPWCLKIAIGLDQERVFENGLPMKEESQVAFKMENEFIEQIEKRTTAHYIGHLFNDEFLDIYWCLEEPEKIHNYLQTQINKERLLRGFGYEINEDPTWETVRQFIYD
ncbi:DUF695 domain-containing protein [Fulvivirgaceae bacterium BMA12]|uniref:DUF695 domain-containing protein n=1 Tax=Agaribacillus aureus TaxID=3051825 RepID=A0ABT8LB81_9BACT|nr:DUF695 domain-containing protein [Fulvivirgaceae bacterium BMA12]